MEESGERGGLVGGGKGREEVAGCLPALRKEKGGDRTGGVFQLGVELSLCKVNSSNTWVLNKIS